MKDLRYSKFFILFHLWVDIWLFWWHRQFSIFHTEVPKDDTTLANPSKLFWGHCCISGQWFKVSAPTRHTIWRPRNCGKIRKFSLKYGHTRENFAWKISHTKIQTFFILIIFAENALKDQSPVICALLGVRGPRTGGGGGWCMFQNLQA